jgi:hypothetical protein
MTDDTAAAPDPETEVALTRAAPEVPLAWSVDDGDDDETLPYDGDDAEPEPLWTDADDSRYSRDTVRLFVGLIGVAVLGASWSVGMWVMHRENRPAPAPAEPAALGPPDVIVPSTTAAPVMQGPSLNGTYQMVFDASAATYFGKAAPPKRVGIGTVWWAFKSSCNALGCTASGVKVDDTDHSRRAATGLTDTFTFKDGQWVDIVRPVPSGIVGCDAASIHWTLTPRPDDALVGRETITVESGCTSAGNGVNTPFTMTRIGGVPAGLFP